MPCYALRKLKRDTRGANFAEYLIIVALVAIAGLGAFRMFGGKVDSKVQHQGQCIESMTSSCGQGSGQGTMGPDRTKQIEQAAKKDDGGGGGLFGWAKSAVGWVADKGGDALGWVGNQATNAIKGAVLGSWAGNTGWAGWIAKVGVGFIPVVGQIADARDTIYAIVQVAKNPGSGKAWADLGVAGIGWVPGVGDAVKESIKGGQQIAKATTGLKPFIQWGSRGYGAANQAAKGEPENK